MSNALDESAHPAGKTETELIEREKRFRKIIETAQEGIWTVDEFNKTDFVNQKLCEIMEYSPAEMMGRELFDFMDEEGKREAIACMERRKLGARENLEVKYLTKSGKQIWASIAANPIFDDNGAYKGSLAMVTDITDRKLADEKLEQQNRELTKTNAELDRFVYSASHELRSPLTSILALISILQTEETDSGKAQLLTLIQNSAENLDVLLRDITNYSRNSRLAAGLEQIDFKQLFNENLEHLLYMEGAAELTYTVDAGTLTKFYTNKVRMSILVNNLLSNAIKYRDPAKPQPFFHISVKSSPGKVLLEFSDNGLGIAAENREKIFDMFYRGSARKTGAGLGLYIVKEIVEKLQGTIRVQSEEGAGTTFLVEIPQVLPEVPGND